MTELVDDPALYMDSGIALTTEKPVSGREIRRLILKNYQIV